MRMTVTLDPDVDVLVKRVMRERRLTFDQALNEAVRAGFALKRRGPAAQFETHDMREAKVAVTKALQLASSKARI